MGIQLNLNWFVKREEIARVVAESEDFAPGWVISAVANPLKFLKLALVYHREPTYSGTVAYKGVVLEDIVERDAVSQFQSVVVRFQEKQADQLRLGVLSRFSRRVWFSGNAALWYLEQWRTDLEKQFNLSGTVLMPLKPSLTLSAGVFKSDVGAANGVGTAYDTTYLTGGVNWRIQDFLELDLALADSRVFGDQRREKWLVKLSLGMELNPSY